MTYLADILICPVALAAALNAQYLSVMTSPTLVAPACPSSGPASADPTYLCVMGRVPDAVRAALDAAWLTGSIDGISLAGVWWYRLNDSGPQKGVVVASFDGSQVGNALPYNQALALNGLQRQVNPLAL